MALWKLPKSSPKSLHSFKYRLYFGLTDGTCLVRYDNESPKGDHKHIGEREEEYRYTDVETLVTDFLNDIKMPEGGAKHEKEYPYRDQR